MTDDERRGALLVTEEWLTVLAVLANSTLDSMEVVTELTLKRPGHPYYQGKLALIQHLREMAEADRVRFGGELSDAD